MEVDLPLYFCTSPRWRVGTFQGGFDLGTVARVSGKKIAKRKTRDRFHGYLGLSAFFGLHLVYVGDRKSQIYSGT